MGWKPGFVHRPASIDPARLAPLLHEVGRLDAAEQAARTAIRQKPDYAEAHVSLAFTLLVAGRFAQPLWDGGAIGTQQRLPLHAEQGLGDTLQLSRFVSRIAAGRRVVSEVLRPLNSSV